jgi:hypothetical protein
MVRKPRTASYRRCFATLFGNTCECPRKNLAPLSTRTASPFVNESLLWLQATCQLFALFHLPSAPDLPSILNESRPAEFVMAVTDF